MEDRIAQIKRVYYEHENLYKEIVYEELKQFFEKRRGGEAPGPNDMFRTLELWLRNNGTDGQILDSLETIMGIKLPPHLEKLEPHVKKLTL